MGVPPNHAKLNFFGIEIETHGFGDPHFENPADGFMADFPTGCANRPD